MRKTAAIMLGEGFEPVEAIAPADALRRAGVAVTLVSTMGEAVVEAAHGIRVTADALEVDVDLGAFDLLVVPGGSLGVENLAKSEVFKRGQVKVWYCRNCGHLEYGLEAPEVCPVCGHPRAYFEIKADNY